MIEEVSTGRFVATEVLPASAEDIERLGPGWSFDWPAAFRCAEVFKLVSREIPDVIFGPLAIDRREGFVEIALLENSPENIGAHKRSRGVAWNLLAFAATISFELGNEGYLNLIAKTELLAHY